MKYIVICGGIVRANGQLALYGTILDEGELDDPAARVKEGYVEEVGEDKAEKGSTDSKPADDPAPVDPAPVLSGNDLIDSAKGKKS